MESRRGQACESEFFCRPLDRLPRVRSSALICVTRGNTMGDQSLPEERPSSILFFSFVYPEGTSNSEVENVFRSIFFARFTLPDDSVWTGNPSRSLNHCITFLFAPNMEEARSAISSSNWF